MIVTPFAQVAMSLLFLRREAFVQYIHNVIERHCSQEETLLISYLHSGPAENNESLAMNNFLTSRTEDKWPAIILHSPDKNRIKFGRPIKVQTYLIFVHYLPKNFNGFINQVESISYFLWWNTEAAFFIVISNVFSDSPQSAGLKILQTLWERYGIIKTFVIVQTLNRSETIPEAQLSFHLYTRLPTHNESLCMAFSSIILLEQWFWDNDNKFPNQSFNKIHSIPTNFNGCPLKVSSALKEYKTVGYNNTALTLEYYEVEMTFLYVLFEKINATLVHNAPHTNSELYSDDLFTSYMDVVLKEADIAVGGIPAIEEISLFFKIARSYFRYRAIWFVPCRQYNSRVESLSRVFDNYTWLIIVTSLLATAITTKYLALLHDTESVSFRYFSTSLLSLWATVLGVGISDLPQTLNLRILFSIFLWYSIAINTIFLTYFTSFILDPGFKDRVHNFDQLLSSGIKFGFDEVYDYHFLVTQDKSYLKVLNHREICLDRKECFDRVSITGDFAYLDNSQSMLMYSILNKDPRICALDDGGVSTPMAMIMHKDSVLIEPMNHVISKLFEAGLPQKLEQDYLLLYKSGKIISKWFSKNGTVNSYNNEKNEYEPLGLDHTHIAFYFLILGYILGMLGVFVELMHYRLKMHGKLVQ
ncbi:Ionotropic receptor 671 [Blattella germanica]|nr:Ionotropic receptor 671 [Blattella germanica]